MKNKLIILPLALALILSFSVGSFALTEANGTGSTLATQLNFTGSTSSGNSSYTVTVPEAIVIGAVPGSNNVTITGYCTQSVNLQAKSASVDMTSTGGNVLPANITFTKLTMGAVIKGTAGSVGGKLSAAWPTGGAPVISSWQGSLGYMVTLS